MQKKTAFLILVISSTLCFAQRGEPIFYELLESPRLAAPVKENEDTVMLWPGVTGEINNQWALYRYGYAQGFAFGTNIHKDKAFGQHFVVDQPYEIVGGRFWFPGKAGDQGYVILTIWDMSEGVPGEKLYEEGIHFSDVRRGFNLPWAWVYDLEESVLVTDDYLIGFDISNLHDYQHSTGTQDGELIYGLGAVSSYMGDGQENWLVWVQRDDGSWQNTRDFGENGWDLDLGFFPYVVYKDGAGSGPHTHEINFRLNMEGARTINGVPFDPELHRVFVSGSFSGWEIPGEDDQYELHPVYAQKKASTIVLYEEDFNPATADGSLPAGWELKKSETPDGQNLREIEGTEPGWYRYSSLYDRYDNLDFEPAWIYKGEAVLHCNWDIETVRNAYAISPAFVLPDDADFIELEFWKYFRNNPAQNWFTKFNVLINADEEWQLLAHFDGAIAGNNLYDEAVRIDLSDFSGNVRLVFVNIWSDAIQLSIDAIRVTATYDDGLPVTNTVYSVTLDVEEGEHEYRYFLIEDKPGWELAERDESENRLLVADKPATVEDTWGNAQPVGILPVPVAGEIKIYPNPVAESLNVYSDEPMNAYAVFDVFGKRMLHSDHAGHTATIDVSGLRSGHYILQIHTNSVVIGKKFHVSR